MDSIATARAKKLVWWGRMYFANLKSCCPKCQSVHLLIDTVSALCNVLMCATRHTVLTRLYLHVWISITLMQMSHFEEVALSILSIWTPATRQLGALDTSDYFFRHSIVNNLGRSGHRICVTDCSWSLFYFVLKQTQAAPSTPHLLCKIFCNCLLQPVLAPCTLNAV